MSVDGHRLFVVKFPPDSDHNNHCSGEVCFEAVFYILYCRCQISILTAVDKHDSCSGARPKNQPSTSRLTAVKGWGIGEGMACRCKALACGCHIKTKTAVVKIAWMAVPQGSLTVPTGQIYVHAQLSWLSVMCCLSLSLTTWDCYCLFSIICKSSYICMQRWQRHAWGWMHPYATKSSTWHRLVFDVFQRWDDTFDISCVRSCLMALLHPLCLTHVTGRTVTPSLALCIAQLSQRGNLDMYGISSLLYLITVLTLTVHSRA